MIDDDVRGRTAVEYRRVKLFLAELSANILTDSRPFEATYALRREAVPLRQSFDLERKPIAEGDVWGRTWESGYFRLKATLPAEWKGHAVAAQLDFGGEALVYSRGGEPLYGLSNGSSFDERYSKDVYRLTPSSQGGEAVELWVEAAANNLSGARRHEQPRDRAEALAGGTYEARIRRLRVCLYHEDAWQLFVDYRALFLLYESLNPELKPGGPHAQRLLRALLAVAQTYRVDPARAALCRALLAPELAKRANASSLATTAVGHAHIDTAWLWTVSESRRKVARTFASQLDLLDRYPGYVFGASAALHHLWVKQDHPALYERLKKAVAAGRWEPQGGMWIEADCNLPSGESLVRQLLHGKNFWKDEFGVEVRNCWIPDVFGYAASLPQLLQLAGIDVLVTHKLAWSKYNEFPHDSFRWRGLGGAEVTVHFPPERTYNSNGTPDALRRAEANFQERGRLDEFLTLLGIGDGGGGPKDEHLETLRRSADLEDVPRARLGRADELLARLHARRGELDVWVGELYLEYHRGTYTTQAATKRHNRWLEQELRVTEALWADLVGRAWPTEFLDATRVLLLGQFHDILPGSSIRAVYDEAEREYLRARGLLAALRERAGALLCEPEAGAVTLYHGLSSSVPVAVALPAGFGAFEAIGSDGIVLPTQLENGRAVVLLAPAPHSFTTLRRGRPLEASRPATGSELLLENDLVRYRFAPDATLLEAWDKQTGRSVLPTGAVGNRVSLYEDTPHNYEAWDIDHYYRAQWLEDARPMAARALGGGPVRRSLEFDLAIGNSTIRQTVRLGPSSKLLVFETTVDWSEARRLLRVAFPVDSLATEATCEIAYGHVRRPTHANTEWDFAKFEVCAHRWVDVGEGEGAALLNDGKYGYSVRGNVLDLALLRAPLYPDPEADQGRHTFTYAFLPRSVALADSEVRAHAEALNCPPLVWEGATAKAHRAAFWVEGEGHVSLEAVKKAEKGEDRILRLVETRGQTSRATLRTSLKRAQIAATDLLEWHDGAWAPFERLEVTLAPFEVKTFRVRVGGEQP